MGTPIALGELLEVIGIIFSVQLNLKFSIRSQSYLESFAIHQQEFSVLLSIILNWNRLGN